MIFAYAHTSFITLQYSSKMSSEVEETLKRIQSHKGVKGVLIMNSEGIPIKSNLSAEDTENYAALVSQLSLKASGVVRTLDRPAAPDPDWDPRAPDPASSAAPWRIYNIGASRPVELLRYIEVLEQELGRKAILRLLPLQPGDVPDTEADVADLARDLDYRPQVTVEDGVARFVAWYRSYYGEG